MLGVQRLLSWTFHLKAKPMIIPFSGLSFCIFKMGKPEKLDDSKVTQLHWSSGQAEEFSSLCHKLKKMIIGSFFHSSHWLLE